MQKTFLFLIPIALGLTACADKNDDFDDRGSASVVSLAAPTAAYMGDSVQVSFSVKSSEFKMNQSKIQLFLGNELTSERIMLTPRDGEYSGKLMIPFRKDIPNQDVTIKVRAQNERYVADEQQTTMNISRPKFSKLTLWVGNQSYDMTPSSTDPYQFSTQPLPLPEKVNAIIKADAYGADGNAMTFGMVDGKITNNVTDSIAFSTVEGNTALYPITFNTLTFEGSPFIKFGVICGKQIFDFDGAGQAANCYAATCTLNKNDLIEISGVAPAEYADYWINPAFFRIVKGTNRTQLRFQGISGTYRIVCDKGRKYLRVYPLGADGKSLANLTKDEDVIWVIGSGNVGMPSYATNKSNWSPAETNAMACCQIRPKVHQIIFENGRTLNGSNINYKFFYQNGWGTEFTGDKISVTDGSTWFRVNTGSSDSGNIFAGSTTLKSGYFYIVTIDATEGYTKCKMSVEEVASIPELDE